MSKVCLSYTVQIFVQASLVYTGIQESYSLAFSHPRVIFFLYYYQDMLLSSRGSPLRSMQASFWIWLASNSHEQIQPHLVGTHENNRIKCTEINTCEPTADMKQALLPSKSVPSLVPSLQNLDSTSFVDKIKIMKII